MFVVDTNVAIVANGRASHADLQCRWRCVEKLEAVVARKVIAIDDQGLIFMEYGKHLSYSGMPGVGDAFFKHVYKHQYHPQYIHRTPVFLSEDERRGFDELPENKFDPSDRKFLVVAVVAKAVVLNATDSDWNEQQELVGGLGVEIEKLCPQHAVK